jgi:hypothetical protein
MEKATSPPKTNKKQSKFEELQNQVDPEVRKKWEEEQSLLKEQLIEEDKFDWYLPSTESDYNDEQEAKGLVKLELIGAVDIRYILFK